MTGIVLLVVALVAALALAAFSASSRTPLANTTAVCPGAGRVLWAETVTPSTFL